MGGWGRADTVAVGHGFSLLFPLRLNIFSCESSGPIIFHGLVSISFKKSEFMFLAEVDMVAVAVGHDLLCQVSGKSEKAWERMPEHTETKLCTVVLIWALGSGTLDPKE